MKKESPKQEYYNDYQSTLENEIISFSKRHKNIFPPVNVNRLVSKFTKQLTNHAKNRFEHHRAKSKDSRYSDLIYERHISYSKTSQIRKNNRFAILGSYQPKNITFLLHSIAQFANLLKKVETPSKTQLKKSEKKIVSYIEKCINFITNHPQFSRSIQDKIKSEISQYHNLGALAFIIKYLEIYMDLGKDKFSEKRDAGWSYFAKLHEELEQNLKVRSLIGPKLERINFHNSDHLLLEKPNRINQSVCIFLTHIKEMILNQKFHNDILSFIYFQTHKYNQKNRHDMIVLLYAINEVKENFKEEDLILKNSPRKSYERTITVFAYQICNILGLIKNNQESENFIKAAMNYAKKSKILNSGKNS